MQRLDFLTPNAWLVAAVLMIATAATRAAAIAPELQRSMAARGTHADTRVIVRFVEPVDVSDFEVKDRRQRNNKLFLALKARSAKNVAYFKPLLDAQDAKGMKELWLINAIAAIVPAVAVKEFAALPEVASIGLDSFVQRGRSQRTPPPRTPRHVVPGSATSSTPVTQDSAVVEVTTATPGWNIAAVHAPELWAHGQTGKGVVVATMDTGVDLAHPDLRRKWRGGTNSWFDPYGEEAAPYDALGHGTQAAGIVAGGSALGVAPDAHWIAVKLYNGNGQASLSDIHIAFQWLMDPDGDPATIDAPDIVNASWALTGRVAGSCIPEFSDDIRALNSAGIAVVFAAGNDGPSPGTSTSPGNNPGALAVGAVGRDFVIERQASRGPSACDGTVFPWLVAPGVNVRTTDISYGGLPSYATVSGSSLAAPHVAGVLALLMGAFPSATVAELEAALVAGAQDLGAAGADNNYGHGLVNALAAFNALRESRGAGQ